VIGREKSQPQLFSMTSLESKIPKDHPLRKIRALCDECMAPLMSAWESLYSPVGQPGIPPQILLRAILLEPLYSIKSQRALCEQIEMNLLFRWFVGLDWDDSVFDHSVLSTCRDRLFAHGATHAFLGEVVRAAESRRLLSSDRMVVDGTLIKAYASMKSFKADDGSEDDKPSFKGTKRSNKTHSSRTDKDARLYRKGKGQESMLCHMGHILVDGASGIIRTFRVTHATGTAEVDAALEMLEEQGVRGHCAVADRGYDCERFVAGTRELGLKAHVRSKSKGSAIDGRTKSRTSYQVSMKSRHIVERAFGWIKAPGRMRQTVFRGTANVEIQFGIYAIAHNLRRMISA
jgi:transposase